MSPVSFNTYSAALPSKVGSTSTSSQNEITTAIKNVITNQDAIRLREELNKTALLPETWQAVLAYAFEQKSSAAIMNVLLQHSACPAQCALELAVQHNNIDVVTQALLRDADPDQLSVRPNTVPMEKLLNFVRRKNILYPPHLPHDQGTDLDCALRKLSVPPAKQEARQLLNQALSGKNIGEAWRDAVKEDQRDIQRAILLLHADKNHSFRLLQENPVMDEGVAKVMKEIPYFPPKRGWPKDFNMQAEFRGKNEKIVCRHLVEHRQAVLRQSESDQLKFDDAQYASSKDITAHVSYDTEAKYQHLMAHAAETHLFHNRDFGKTLVQQFNEMERKQEATRLILLESTNHAMSVELKIKKKDGKTHYVARLFDPNATTSHVRVASDNLRTLERMTLKAFIDEDAHKVYYPESGSLATTSHMRVASGTLRTLERMTLEDFIDEEAQKDSESDALSMMFVRPSAQEEQAMANHGAGAVENRTLTSSIGDKKINATALWHMLTQGFAGDLRRLKNEIVSRPKEEQIHLLTAKDANGTPGLYRTLQNGHADAIKAFGELLEQLQLEPEECIRLLAVKNARGVPGLYMALQNGHADAIKEYGKLLEQLQLKPEECIELLAVKDHRGISGLFFALLNGHADAIKEYGELLMHVPPEKLVELLSAKDGHGIPGLFFALLNGRADAIKEYGELLMHVPPEERVALLSAKDADGVSGLFFALHNSHTDAIKEYGELLMHVPPEERVTLLSVKDPYGISVLYTALHNGHADVIKEYGKLLEQLQLKPEEWSELLTAKNALGISGLYMALQNGHANVIKEYGELLKHVSPEERIALLSAKNARGTPGLCRALERGRTDAIKEYGELLKHVPPEELVTLLLSAKDARGTPGLYMALERGHADTIKEYGELLKHVPREELVALLSAKDARGTPGLYRALERGHARTIKVFGELLEQLQLKPEECAELLAAKDARGISGLHMAEQNNHVDAIKEYDELLKHVPSKELIVLRNTALED